MEPTVSGGDGAYEYQWQTRTTYSTWDNASGAAGQRSYTTMLPLNTVSVIYYRRNVTSCGIIYYSNEAKVVSYTKPTQGALSAANVCPNTATTISGATPAGGNGSYTYQWLTSTNGTTWTAASGTNNTVNYIFTSPATAKTYSNYYRRVVLSCNMPDSSASIRILTSGSISQVALTQPEVCPNVSVTLSSAASGGNGTFAYLWQTSTDNATWATASGTSNAANYTFTSSATVNGYSAYYRRIVTSCGVGDTTASVRAYSSGGVVQTTVAQQNVCPGDAVTLSPGAATGGDGSYTYLWQSASNIYAAGNWSNVSTSYNAANSSLALTAPTLNMYYRRLVQTCSGTVTVTHTGGNTLVYVGLPVSQSTIAAQSICPGTSATLNPGAATGGSGTYTYQWQKSLNNTDWTSIVGATSVSYAASASTTANEIIYYRRMAYSCNGASQNIGTSIPIQATANIAQASLSNQEVCPSATVQLTLAAATGGNSTFAYQWQRYSDTTNSWVNIAGATGLSHSFVAPDLPNSYSSYYRRMVTSCGITAASNGARAYAISIDLAGGTLEPQYDVANGSSVNLRVAGASANDNQTYLWQTSVDKQTWMDIAPTVTTANYVVAAPVNVGVYTDYLRRKTSACDISTYSTETRIFASLDCPYKGRDLVDGSCQQRIAGAKNWEATIRDARDQKQYRIVQMPNGDWWLAQSMNYQLGLKKVAAAPAAVDTMIGYYYCYGGSDVSCETYGSLYSWHTAMANDGVGVVNASSNSMPSGVRGICPTGWHMPSSAELRSMLECVEGNCYGTVFLNCGTETGASADCGTYASQRLRAVLETGTATDYNPLWSVNTYPPSDDYGFSGIPGGYTTTSSTSRGSNSMFWTSHGEGSYANNMELISTLRPVRLYANPKYYGYGIRCVADATVVTPSASTAPTKIEATAQTVSSGGTTILTAVGGVLGSAGSYQWSTNAAFSPIIAGVNDVSITQNPTVTTTYYVRRTDSGGATTTAASLTITVLATGKCPYMGNDLIEGTCKQRATTEANWEAKVLDARDGKTYRIVQMPDGNWWLAENLHYQTGLQNAGNSNQPNTTVGDPTNLQGYYWCPGAVHGSGSATGGQQTCDTYGAFYPWRTIMSEDGRGTLSLGNNTYPSRIRGICPFGWHVPSSVEWSKMLDCVEGNCSSAFNETMINVWAGTAGVPLRSSATGTSTSTAPLWTNHATYNGTDVYGFSILPSGYRNSDGANFVDRGIYARFWTTTPAGAYAVARLFYYDRATSYHAVLYEKSFGFSVRCVYDGAAGIPSVTSTAPTSIEVACSGTTLTLTAVGGKLSSSGTYEWGTGSTIGSSILPGQTSASITTTTANTYWVRRKDGATPTSGISIVIPAIALPTVVNSQAACIANGFATISATASAGATIDWYSAATDGSLLQQGGESFTTPAVVTATTTYYAQARNLATGCVSAARAPILVTLGASNPTVTSASSSAACSGSASLSLSVTVGAGVTADWYDAATGGSLLAGTSLSYTTPILSASKTYYVEARNTTTGCRSETRKAVTATIGTTLPVPIITDASGTTSATITAEVPLGCTVDWYTVATGGAAVSSGLTYAASAPVLVYAETRNTSNAACVSPRIMVAAHTYSGVEQSRVLTPGKYKIECWGAGGGVRSGGVAGLGGYAKGEMQLSTNQTVYFYIGGQGLDGCYNGTGNVAGWNGGGNQGPAGCSSGGGGATDIRLVNGDWFNITGLRSRIIVAGGGGGTETARGSHGGGLQGGANYAGSLATQNAGGGFGFGPSTIGDASGAGGGYYSGYPPTGDGQGGGGGSGFVSGMPGCDAITSAASGTHTGQPNHYSGLVFTNASMQSGVRSGNGLVVITSIP